MMSLARWGVEHAAPETKNYLEKILKSNEPEIIKSALRLINVMPGLLKNDWFLNFTHFLKSSIPEARYYCSEILKQKNDLPPNVQQELSEYLKSPTVTSDIDAVVSFMKL
jgi:recombinational DNA repair protein RecT